MDDDLSGDAGSGMHFADSRLDMPPPSASGTLSDPKMEFVAGVITRLIMRTSEVERTLSSGWAGRESFRANVEARLRDIEAVMFDVERLMSESRELVDRELPLLWEARQAQRQRFREKLEQAAGDLLRLERQRWDERVAATESDLDRARHGIQQLGWLGHLRRWYRTFVLGLEEPSLEDLLDADEEAESKPPEETFGAAESELDAMVARAIQSALDERADAPDSPGKEAR